MKKFEFVSRAAIKAYLALPKDIQYQFGTDLKAVQQGKDPFSAHKVLTETVGPGAIELIENGSPAYRAVYCVKHPRNGVCAARIRENYQWRGPQGNGHGGQAIQRDEEEGGC
jgi:phage-related protein